MEKTQLAYMYIVPDADPSEHKATISKSAFFNLTVVGVKDYQQAGEVARELVNQGVQVIELCSGFDDSGVAKVAQAVADKAAVGAVRFDCHSSMAVKSGDTIG